MSESDNLEMLCGARECSFWLIPFNFLLDHVIPILLEVNCAPFRLGLKYDFSLTLSFFFQNPPNPKILIGNAHRFSRSPK